MTTDELIEALERLEKEATPGPWEVEDRPTEIVLRWYDVDADDDGRTVDRGNEVCVLTDVMEALINAELVATLRNHLPALISALKENKRLREALEAIPELIADQADHDVLAVVWTALQPQGLVAALLNTPVRNAAKKKRGTQVIKPQGDAKP